MNMTKNSAKQLAQAQADQAKLETALNRSKQEQIDRESEVETLAKDHRAAATSAAIEGDPAPPAPLRLAQANAELTTGRAVLTDLETRLTDARAAVVTAEQAHKIALRREVVGKIEKRGQALWLEIADKFTELVDLTGQAGWDAVHSLTWSSGNLYPDKCPIKKALAAEGLDEGEGGEIDVIPAGKFAQDWTDPLLERINGEVPKPFGPRI